MTESAPMPFHCPNCGQDMDRRDASLGPLAEIEIHAITCAALGGSGVPLPKGIRD
jgi:hypothetical protein